MNRALLWLGWCASVLAVIPFPCDELERLEIRDDDGFVLSVWDGVDGYESIRPLDVVPVGKSKHEQVVLGISAAAMVMDSSSGAEFALASFDFDDAPRLCFFDTVVGGGLDCSDVLDEMPNVGVAVNDTYFYAQGLTNSSLHRVRIKCPRRRRRN